MYRARQRDPLAVLGSSARFGQTKSPAGSPAGVLRRRRCGSSRGLRLTPNEGTVAHVRSLRRTCKYSKYKGLCQGSGKTFWARISTAPSWQITTVRACARFGLLSTLIPPMRRDEFERRLAEALRPRDLDVVLKVTAHPGRSLKEIGAMIGMCEDNVKKRLRVAQAAVGIRTKVLFIAVWHVLLFLKHGVWRYWYEHQTEYDRVKPSIQHLAWQHEDELAALIARRIADKRNEGYEESNVEALWCSEFVCDGEFRDFVARLVSFCANGPRDLIGLLNEAKIRAGNARISWDHIDKALNEFSQNKLYSLNGDFGDVYPDIAVFVAAAVRGQSARKRGEDLAHYIEEEILMNDRISEALKSHRWFRFATKESLLQLMYEIGFLGRLREDGSEVYAIQSPHESYVEIRTSTLIVHPVFRRYLDVKD